VNLPGEGWAVSRGARTTFATITTHSQEDEGVLGENRESRLVIGWYRFAHICADKTL